MRRKRITITIRDDVLKKIDTIIDGKNIRNRSNAIETVLLEKFKNKIIQKAVILGAYRGVKIKGKTISEILIPVGEKTLIEHNIKKLKSIGVNEIIMATGNFEKEVFSVLGNGDMFGVKINYIKSKGTARVFQKVKDLLKSSFIMCNGDIMLDNIDLEEMYYFHKKNKNIATIAIATVTDYTSLGSVFVRGDKIVKYLEKAEKNSGSHMVSSGVYMMESAVCAMPLSKSAMLEHDIFPKLAKTGMLGGYHLENWLHLHDEKHLKRNLKK